MQLAGVPVRDEAVLELARLFNHPDTAAARRVGYDESRAQTAQMKAASGTTASSAMTVVSRRGEAAIAATARNGVSSNNMAPIHGQTADRT